MGNYLHTLAEAQSNCIHILAKLKESVSYMMQRLRQASLFAVHSVHTTFSMVLYTVLYTGAPGTKFTGQMLRPSCFYCHANCHGH